MESSERSTTEDNLCDSLNDCINLANSATSDSSTSKIRQKRPDREFYVPPNVHMSKVKAAIPVANNSPQLMIISSKHRRKGKSANKVKKSETELITEQLDNQDLNNVIKVTSNKEGKIEQKENRSVRKHESSDESSPVKSPPNLSESEPSWDEIYDDNGDCVQPQLVEQFCDINYQRRSNNRLTVNNGNQTANLDFLDDYEASEEDDKLAHVLEIYDFPSDLRTQDLVTSLSVFNSRDFDIKWVDDSHALAVFSSQTAAKEAMSMPYHNMRLRPLKEAIKESRIKAQKCAEHLLPYRQRPQTSAILARRLVTGALGIRSNISSEQRAAEKKLLQEAKGEEIFLQYIKKTMLNKINSKCMGRKHWMIRFFLNKNNLPNNGPILYIRISRYSFYYTAVKL